MRQLAMTWLLENFRDCRLTFQRSAAPAEPASILVVSTIHCANGVPEMCEHGKRSARLWDWTCPQYALHTNLIDHHYGV